MRSIKSLFRLSSKFYNSSDRLVENELKDTPIIIVDIGCRWGFAERFLDPKFHRRMKIFGFDPDAEECERLEASYRDHPRGFINCIPLALGEKPGKRNLFITKEPACSSLHPPIKYLSETYPALKCTEIDKVVSIDVVNFHDWASINELKSLDYVKIDTQGSELEILRGAEGYLQTIRCLDIEVEFNPIYEGQSLFWETDSFLRSKGFVLWRISNLVHYSNGGNLIELNDSNAICFDDNVRQETKVFGGQLFWADARYVHSSVIYGSAEVGDVQLERDLVLFEALGMYDVVSCMQKERKVR